MKKKSKAQAKVDKAAPADQNRSPPRNEKTDADATDTNRAKDGHRGRQDGRHDHINTTIDKTKAWAKTDQVQGQRRSRRRQDCRHRQIRRAARPRGGSQEEHGLRRAFSFARSRRLHRCLTRVCVSNRPGMGPVVTCPQDVGRAARNARLPACQERVPFTRLPWRPGPPKAQGLAASNARRQKD